MPIFLGRTGGGGRGLKVWRRTFQRRAQVRDRKEGRGRRGEGEVRGGLERWVERY